MKPPGVIVNARAGLVRREPNIPDRLRRLVPDEYVHFTHDTAQLDAALVRLRELAIEQLLIVGGDGTAGGTLTRLVRLWGDAPLPRVALTRGGTVNTIAQSLGARLDPEAALHAILDERPPRADSLRPLVRAEPEDPGPDGANVRLGLIFANGVAARWLELYYESEDVGPRAAAGLVARIARSALTGTRLAESLFEPARVAISVDDEAIDAESFTIMGAASVRDIGLGFRPFLSVGTDPRRFHFLWSDAHAMRLCLELPALRIGFYGPASCLRHYSAREVVLRFAAPEPWSMDADLAPPTALLQLSAGPQVRFTSY